MCKTVKFLTLAPPLEELKKDTVTDNSSPLHQGFALEPKIIKMNALKAAHRPHQVSPVVSPFSTNFMPSKEFGDATIA